MNKKLPIACFITDIHLSLSNKEVIADICKQYVTLLNKLGLKEGFNLGDTFNSRNAQPLDVTKFFDTTILQMFKEAKITLHTIAGNHDRVNLDDEYSYLTPFSDRSYFNLIEGYSIIPTAKEPILMIPYFKEDGKYLDYLSDATKELGKEIKNTYLGTHIAANGVHNNDGSVVENGIALKMFKLFKKTFIGHYHDKSVLGGNVHYIGACRQANFGEDQDKGFTVLYSDGTHELIKSTYRKFVKVTIDATDPTAIEQIKKELGNSPDKIRLEFKGSGTVLAAIDKSQYEKMGMEVSYKKDDINIDDVEEVVEFKSYDKNTLKDAYQEFGVINEFEDTTLDLQYLKKI